MERRLMRRTALGAVLATGMGLAIVQAQSALSAWDGVYSKAQAQRGNELLTSGQCRTCHTETLGGGAGIPAIVGVEFQFKWDGKSVGELYDYILTKMPPGAPGSLTDQKTADIVAALLAADGYPAGEGKDLPADASALAGITITASK
jgi:mono/diheme cytochrome c family protein